MILVAVHCVGVHFHIHVLSQIILDHAQHIMVSIDTVVLIVLTYAMIHERMLDRERC
jgi:hypothetical protein